MKDLAIVVNKYLKNQKFDQIVQLLLKESQKNDLSVDVYNNDELLNVSSKVSKLVLFLDKDIKLAKRLELYGNDLVNNALAIEVADDKYLSYLLLSKNNIKTPTTVNSPFSYTNVGYHGDYNFLKDVEKSFDYPIVIKQSKGSFGEQVYIAFNREELERITKTYEKNDLLYQEFISTTHINPAEICKYKRFISAKDVRIEIVAGECVAAMERVAQEGEFRANATLGAQVKKYEPNNEEILVAKKVAKVFNLDIAGIDLIRKNDGELFVCEVNSNAHFKLISEVCKINIAEKIIKYCKDRINNV